MFFSRYQGVNSITLHFINFIKFQTLFEIMLQHSQLSSGCYYYLVVLLTVVVILKLHQQNFQGFFVVIFLMCHIWNVFISSVTYHQYLKPQTSCAPEV